MRPEVSLDEFRDRSVALYANSQLQNMALIGQLAPVSSTIFLLPADLAPEHVIDIVREHDIAHLVSALTLRTPAHLISPQEITGLGQDQYPPIIENLTLTPDQDLADFVLATSGTTGRPKLVRHSFAFLSSSVKTGSQDGQVRRWGLVYDVCRFAGFQVAVQCLLTRSVLIAPDVSLPMDQKIAILIDQGVTHLSATPSFWRRWLMSPLAKRAPLKRITLGGEIVDQGILDKLRAVYPAAKISHIYASTEAGVGFTVADGQEGFPVSFVDDDSGNPSMKVENGRLFVRRKDGATGYLGKDAPGFTTPDNFVDTGDAVERRGNRYVFLGRDNGSINIGGVKVFPEVTERRLLEHESVKACVVYPAKSGMMGNTLNCTVVLEHGANQNMALKFELMRWCKEALAPEFVPTKVKFADKLALSASGKLDRKSL